MRSIFGRMLRHTVFGDFWHSIKLNRFRRRWIKMHQEGDSYPMNIFPLECVQIGKRSYGELNVITFNNKSKLKIGRYVSIAQNVFFLLDVEHHINHISTYPFITKLFNNSPEAFSKGDIIVEDDVWIGFGAVIMSGVTIGQGAVIAAGALVTKNVEPYSVVGGVPARVIKYRFSQDICKELIRIDYGKLDDELIMKHKDMFYEEIINMDSIKKITWLPRRKEG